MTANTINFETLLKEVQAWHTGHFTLASGRHSNQYIQCQRLLQYPRYGLQFAQALVKNMLQQGLEPESIVGPALGAVHWELLVAQALDKEYEARGKKKPVRAIFAERPDGEFEIRRGIEIGKDEPVFVVEDVTTTGGSALKVVELVRKLGGKPIGVGAIIDRSGGTASFDVPFLSLVKLELETWQPEDCPLCKQGQPIVKPGSSKNKA